MKTILLFLTAIGWNLVVIAEPAVDACPISVSGKILYKHQGVYRRVSATIRGTSPDCATLSVPGTSGGHTSNRISKISLKKERSGREAMTMLFENPPAVGDGE